MAERERIEEQKRERIAERRLRGGSRFNIRSSFVSRRRAGDNWRHLHGAEGLSRADAARLFGVPASTSERWEGADQRVTADFVDLVLIRYTIMSRECLDKAC